jgi:hypothetical protein
LKLFCSRVSIALLFLAGLASLPAQADDQDKTAKIELKSPTQISGTTLKPGTYVFKLSGSDSGWNIIKVYNADQSSLITTVLAYPNPKLQRTGDEQVLMYSHAPKSGTHVMKGWFFDGENEAQQWAYPNTIAEKIGKANNDRIPTTGTDDVYPSSLPKAAESWTPPVTTASNDNAQNENTISSTTTPETAHARKLPRTASSAPLAGLIGIIAALGIVGLRRTARATS